MDNVDNAAGEQAQGVPWDEDVFMSDEVREAAVLAYSTDNKMSDRRFKEQQLRRIAFRAGAAWYAKEHGQ